MSRFVFYHLHNITKVRHFLPQSDAERLDHALISSCLDYCNSLLFDCLNKSLMSLQLVQNAAAQVLTVNFRVDFTYKAVYGLASYLNELYDPTRVLCSQNTDLLVVPRVSKSSVRGQAFSYQALWYELPVWVQEADSVII